MTRLLAFGDTQIGVATVTLCEQQKVLKRIVATALEHKVDLVLHGGDVFEGPVVTPEHLRMFIDGIRPLRDADIPVVVIRGNGRHDLATRPVHALDVLREVSGITVSDRPELIGAGGLQIATLPWVHPGNLIAQTNGSLTHDQASEQIAEALVRIAADLRAQALSAGPCVLLAHWAISGATLPTGLPVDQLREPVLSWPDLDAIGFDLIVGAHVHEAQRLDHPELGDKTLGIVVGSPQQQNHGEHGEHGCWLLDISEAIRPSAVHADFIPIESQRFVTLDCGPGDGDGGLLWPETWAGECENAIVRVRFTATDEQARRIDHAGIRHALQDAGAAKVTIEPTIERSARVRSEAISDQLGPLDALSVYCQAQSVEDPMRERMTRTLSDWMATSIR